MKALMNKKEGGKSQLDDATLITQGSNLAISGRPGKAVRVTCKRPIINYRSSSGQSSVP